ncbi:unnamed protein product [Adineta steineri]|uniref:Uncharacterized protein n=1 Tax=Adineta steineri TaxID=433720 RepID=A0A816D348_9BILA|nr:unnamed protein product [Adineta steineri]CAF1627929.1 unnamed protein product [Adineta steineri]
MNSSNATEFKTSAHDANVLTCANHPTVFGTHKCYRCQKILCLQCYNPRGPGYGFCPECHAAESQSCCTIS